MANFNKVFLLGRLTTDIELRHTQSGTAIAKFSMATNRTYTVDGQKKETTCFVDLQCFGKSGETLAQYAKKGDPLFVEGRLELEQWEKDGQKRSKHSISVENFQFLAKREEEAPAPKAKKTSPRSNTGGAADYGDVPF